MRSAPRRDPTFRLSKKKEEYYWITYRKAPGGPSSRLVIAFGGCLRTRMQETEVLADKTGSEDQAHVPHPYRYERPKRAFSDLQRPSISFVSTTFIEFPLLYYYLLNF